MLIVRVCVTRVSHRLFRRQSHRDRCPKQTKLDRESRHPVFGVERKEGRLKFEKHVIT